MSSYQYRKPNGEYKTIFRPSYPNNSISYTGGQMTQKTSYAAGLDMTYHHVHGF